MPRRALLIVNRLSRSGDADLASAIDFLRGAGLDVRPHGIEDAKQIPELIRAHRGLVDLIVLGGGDGTMNAASEAVLELGVPMALLPLGTANDLARTLGIPAELEGACAVVAAGVRHRIDLGRVNGKYFFNVASVGLSVAVARMIDSDTKKRWGSLGYGLTVLRAVRENRPFRARVTCDGRVRSFLSIQLAIGNGRHYGGGMTVAKDAAIDDHMLDLYSIGPVGLAKLVLIAPSLRTGRQGDWHGVHLLRGQRIEVVTHRPMAVNTDGEVTARTPALFEVVPQAIELLVPPEFVEASGAASAAE